MAIENQINSSGVDEENFFQMSLNLPDALTRKIRSLTCHESKVFAPANIDLRRRQSAPLLYAAANSETRSDLVSSSSNTSVLAVDLDTGSLTAINAFPLDPKKSYPPAPPREVAKSYPVDLGTEVDSVSKVWLDLKKLQLLPWKPGKHAVRVLQYDRISDAAVISLVDPAGKGHAGPGVPADYAQKIEMDARRANAAPGGLRAFEVRPGTPKLDGRGVAFTMPARLTPRDVIPLYAAAKLPLGSGMIVDPRQVTGDKPIMREDLPVAVVPVSIVVAELDRVPPRRVEVKVPCHGVEPQPGAEATLSFSLDLKSLLPAPLEPGTYFVYMLAGQYLDGPHRVDVVQGN